MTQRDWQKDMDTCIEEQAIEDAKVQSRWMGAMGPTIASYWLQEAKEQKERADAAEAREQKLIDIMHIIAFESDDEKTQKYASQMLATLYPDTPAPKEVE